MVCTTTNDEPDKLSIPTTNYTINYPQLRQAGTLHKVGQAINIITTEKRISTYQNKTISKLDKLRSKPERGTKIATRY